MADCCCLPQVLLLLLLLLVGKRQHERAPFENVDLMLMLMLMPMRGGVIVQRLLTAWTNNQAGIDFFLFDLV